jgi:hypothetical protein
MIDIVVSAPSSNFFGGGVVRLCAAVRIVALFLLSPAQNSNPSKSVTSTLVLEFVPAFKVSQNLF